MHGARLLPAWLRRPVTEADANALILHMYGVLACSHSRQPTVRGKEGEGTALELVRMGRQASLTSALGPLPLSRNGGPSADRVSARVAHGSSVRIDKVGDPTMHLRPRQLSNGRSSSTKYIKSCSTPYVHEKVDYTMVLYAEFTPLHNDRVAI